jgi:hypothetical protein
VIKKPGTGEVNVWDVGTGQRIVSLQSSERRCRRHAGI